MKILRHTLPLTFVLLAFPTWAGTTVHSTYQADYFGLPVSSAFIALHLDEKGYTFGGKGRASALASLFKPMNAELEAKGSFGARAVKPESFAAKISGKSGGYDILLNITHGNVIKEVSLPKRENPPADFVPLTEQMKRGIIDPLSAFLIPVKVKNIDTVCQRTLPVYTGRERFDILLSPGRTEQVNVPGLYQGEAIVCMGRYKPIGGHRSDKSEVKYMIENRDMEAWFIPLPGAEVMGLYRVSIGTKLGPLNVELEKAMVVPDKAAPQDIKPKK